MVSIIKRYGNYFSDDENFKFKVNCECGCIFIGEKDDIKTNYDNEDCSSWYPYIKCPECCNRIKLGHLFTECNGPYNNRFIPITIITKLTDEEFKRLEQDATGII